MAFVMVLLQVPFIWVKRIERLKNMALIGVIGLVIFSSSFLVHYVMVSSSSNINENPVGGMVMLPKDWVAAIATIPNIIYALSYFANFFPIYKGMKRQTN
jgi:amino acid permease